MTPPPAPIDWAQPWYAPLRDIAAHTCGHDNWLSLLDALNAHSAAQSLCNHRDLPLRFVPQSQLPDGTAYESHISHTGHVPTRHSLHDLFNALIWLSYPHTKARLNALQAAQIAHSGINPTRGPARDAITLFDENAVILAVRNTPQGHALTDALRAHHWSRAFIELRHSFGQHAQVWPFGHALLEKLTTPYKAITAHTWVLSVPDDFFHQPHSTRRAWLDQHLAHELAQRPPGTLTPAAFTPLPVLGIPGWWPEQTPAFYADTSVFRPKRKA